MPRPTIPYSLHVKINRILISCITVEQLSTAKQFIRLAREQNIITEAYFLHALSWISDRTIKIIDTKITAAEAKLEAYKQKQRG